MQVRNPQTVENTRKKPQTVVVWGPEKWSRVRESNPPSQLGKLE